MGGGCRTPCWRNELRLRPRTLESLLQDEPVTRTLFRSCSLPHPHPDRRGVRHVRTSAAAPGFRSRRRPEDQWKQSAGFAGAQTPREPRAVRHRSSRPRGRRSRGPGTEDQGAASGQGARRHGAPSPHKRQHVSPAPRPPRPPSLILTPPAPLPVAPRDGGPSVSLALPRPPACGSEARG